VTLDAVALGLGAAVAAIATIHSWVLSRRARREQRALGEHVRRSYL